MEFQRAFLVTVIFVLSFLLYGEWQKNHVAPEANAQVAAQAANGGASQNTTANEPAVPAERIIHVKTDVFDVEIDSLGGAVTSVKLRDFPESLENPNTPVQLLNDATETRYTANSALVVEPGKINTAHMQFNAIQKNFELANNEKDLQIVLSAQINDVVEVNKIYTFHQNSYVVDVQFSMHNLSNTVSNVYQFSEISRKIVPPKSNMFALGTYTGAAISSKDIPYEKIKIEDMQKEEFSRNITGGWAAMLQHYFLAAWIPPEEQSSHYYSRFSGNDHYTIGLASPVSNVSPQQFHVVRSRLYVGPEDADALRQVAPHLERTVDYGKLWFLSEGIFWLMKFIYNNVISNWGWSIILVTVIIKALFFKLSESSYRSMAKMRELQPKLKELEQKTGGDKQKLAEETMALYRKEKVNPLSGCFAILPQIPVFLALYWVLVECVHLRMAPFALWINDLSTKDPYYVLPILMGISMIIQSKLSPAPSDPVQAKVMLFMPVMFTFFFLTFPSGLVLYWLVNNVLSILQQWWIMNRLATQSAQK